MQSKIENRILFKQVSLLYTPPALCTWNKVLSNFQTILLTGRSALLSLRCLVESVSFLLRADGNSDSHMQAPARKAPRRRVMRQSA